MGPTAALPTSARPTLWKLLETQLTTTAHWGAPHFGWWSLFCCFTLKPARSWPERAEETCDGPLGGDETTLGQDDSARAERANRGYSHSNSATRYGLHSHLFTVGQLGRCDTASRPLHTEEWESCGQDWPDAYRFYPMSSDEALCGVVAFFHHEWQRPAFMTYTGLLFGSSLAAASFNRYSRFVEALSRRFAFCLTCLHFDNAHVTDRNSCKGSGQRAMQTLNTLLGTPFFRGEMPEDAELWYIFGTRSRFHSSSCLGRHPVLGARAHLAQAAPPYEGCRGFQQISTRSSRQDLWHRHLLWAWCMGTSRLRWPCPYQAQTTRTHLRVDWGVASMLQSAANHHRYQTLQADRDLAARGATFSSSLRCCIVKPRSGYRRISGSVAWWPHTTAWSFCLDHPSIGVPPLGTGRQEDCPTGAASGPLCIVFTSFSVSWPRRTLVHWQYSGQLSWFTQDCFLVSLWPSRPSIDTVVWWKLCRVDLHSVWRVCILMMHMWLTGSLSKDRARSYAVHAQGTIQSWARERIEHKLLHLMKHAEDSSKLQPGVAAKIYGVANFFGLGVWGRIGCGGLAPIKRRQQ